MAANNTPTFAEKCRNSQNSTWIQDERHTSDYLSSSCVLLKRKKNWLFFKWTYNSVSKKRIKQKKRKAEGNSRKESKYGQKNKEEKVGKSISKTSAQ